MKNLRRITLRTNILTIFLSLIILSFGFVLLFIRHKDFDSVSELSNRRMEIIQERVNEKIDDLVMGTEQLVETGSFVVFSIAEITPDNQHLRQYMLRVIQNYPDIAYFYFGTQAGNFIQVVNLSLSGQTHYTSNLLRPLPQGAIYKWESIFLSENGAQATSYYFDLNLKELGSEVSFQSDFDPRSRPWYQGAEQTNALYWTDVYNFFDTGKPGISVAVPLHDPQGELIGVSGADLSFELLSQFFLKQKIGKTGGIFLLDKEGQIIIPTPPSMRLSSIPEEAVIQVFQRQNGYFQLEVEGVRYLAHVEPFPVRGWEDWSIVTIAPFDDFFAALKATQRSVLLIVAIILLFTSFIAIYFAKRLSKPIVVLSSEVDKIRQLDFRSEERVDSWIKEIFLMDASIASMRSAMHSFTRYVPKQIVQQLLSQGKEIVLGGEKRELTVLFSDIADFTSITEQQPTELLMSLLAEYFDSLSKIIIEMGGTIDKYIGDSIMAFWGAPTPVADHAIACAKTALLCRDFVHQFNQQRILKNQPLFKTRFGMNTGVAIIGNIGTPERMNYTPIGDMVNIASRLQQANKIYHTEILISQSVQKQLGEQFVTRYLDLIEVKGKKEKISIYELVSLQKES